MRFEECDLINSKVKRHSKYTFEIYFKPAWPLGWDIEDSGWKLASDHSDFDTAYQRLNQDKRLYTDFNFKMMGKEVTTETMTQDIRIPDEKN